MSLPLAGKVAVVTGSSRSIGAATATRLAADGANVVINYVSNAVAAASVADAINARSSSGSGKAIVVKADISSPADNQRLLDEAIRQFGHLDILVLNAGIMGEAAGLSDVDDKFFDDHFSINVKAPLFMVKAAAPLMKAGGRIIFFSSTLTHASTITPNYLIYAATKGAVEQISRVLAKELGARGINVNTVAPGPIDTELFRSGKSEELIKFIGGFHPMKRIGRPDEVSSVVAFLAREEASWVNGQTIMVNGGFAV